jgi:hypothetical protein
MLYVLVPSMHRCSPEGAITELRTVKSLSGIRMTVASSRNLSLMSACSLVCVGIPFDVTLRFNHRSTLSIETDNLNVLSSRDNVIQLCFSPPVNILL